VPARPKKKRRPAASLADVIKVVTGIDETVATLEKDSGLTKSRVGILEKHAQEMQSIPAVVSGLNAKVESLSSSLNREVDGVRQQNIAHKEELMSKLDLTSSTIGNGMRTLSVQVGALVEKDKTSSLIKRFLLKTSAYIAGILAAGAAVAEIIRACYGK
jgi:hypothetical protein